MGDQLAELKREVCENVEGLREDLLRISREIHANPELGNREFRTASLVAAELEALGLEVRTEVAHTGVVGLLRGRIVGVPLLEIRARIPVGAAHHIRHPVLVEIPVVGSLAVKPVGDLNPLEGVQHMISGGDGRSRNQQ